MPDKTKCIDKNKKIIIIDGQNVALVHGKQKIFSCKGIQIAIDYFVNLGHDVKVVLPKWRSYDRLDINKRECVDFNLLKILANNGYINYVPERRNIDGTLIRCDLPKYILNISNSVNGIIVSQAGFKNSMTEEYRDIINYFILPFDFINDTFIIPNDPNGRYGPDINDFLKIT